MEIITSGEQRYAKVFVAAGISVFLDTDLLASWKFHLVFLLNSDCFVICVLPAMWHISCTCLAKEGKIRPCSALKIVQPSVRPVVSCGGIAVITPALGADSELQNCGFRACV